MIEMHDNNTLSISKLFTDINWKKKNINLKMAFSTCYKS